VKTIVRWFALISLVLVAALAILEIVNYQRVDAGGLGAGVDTLIARSRDLEKLARPEYQDHTLAALPANHINGAYYRTPG
jgi:hypothetical protein